jgi:uncharacterized protein (DUF488 family)
MDSMTLYTIGFTQKTAADFFGILRRARVKRLIDIRLNNVSQLAGFTKRDDLAFFLRELCDCAYEHHSSFAPTRDILDAYKKRMISWVEYERRFNLLMREREVEKQVRLSELDRACLLCSEPTPDNCHRRLVAEHLRDKLGHLEIVHL